MKRKITLLAILISISLASLCQVNLDSLRSVWNDPKQPDTSRLKAIHKIAWNGYLFSKPDSSFYFAQLQYNFAKSKGLKKQMASALNTQGVKFLMQGDYTRAIDYYTRCLNILEDIGDRKGVAYSLNNIGMIYHNQGDYASAIEYYTRSLIIKEEIGNKRGIAIALNNIGIIYHDFGDYASAIDYHTRSLAIREKIRDKSGIADALNNIGIVYNDLGEYTRAIDYHTRSLNIKEEIGDKGGIANSLNNIGNIYNHQGDSALSAGNTSLSADKYTSAIENFTRSIAIREEIGDKLGLADALNNIGNIYKHQGDFSTAITYNKRALNIAQEVGAALETRNAANAVYEIYKATGRNKLALEMYELYIATRDSIDSEENQKEVIRQKYKYEYDKKAIADSVTYVQVQKVQEAKLEKSRILQYTLIGGVTLLLVFLGYVFNRFRVTRKQKLLISKQNKELTIATEKAESANSELKTKSEELEKFNAVMLDREMRIIELKKEANKIANDNNTDIPYPEVEDE